MKHTREVLTPVADAINTFTSIKKCYERKIKPDMHFPRCEGRYFAGKTVRRKIVEKKRRMEYDKGIPTAPSKRKAKALPTVQAECVTLWLRI